MCQKHKINVSVMKHLYHAIIIGYAMKRYYLNNDFLGTSTGCLNLQY